MIAQTIELRALIASLTRGDTPIVLGFAADGSPVANDQLVGLLPRIKTLEGLAGIPGGSNLAAQVDALNNRVGAAEGKVGELANDNVTARGTRYYGRPAKDLRAWTTQLTAAAKDAVPMTATGAASLTTNGPGGAALCITGVGTATSIAKIPIDDGDVIELTFKQARRTDNTGANAAANNIPVNDVACYGADDKFISTAPFPAIALLKSDLVRSVTYRASLTPALSQVVLPAGTRSISPVVGERGASGAMEFYAVERGTQSLTAAPLITTLGDTDFIATVSGDRKSPGLLPFAVFKDLTMEKFYNRTAYASAGPDAAVILPYDPARNSVDLMNPSSTTTILMSYDGPPALGQIGTRPLAPGEGYFREHGPTGPLWVKSLGDTVPLVFDYTNSSNLDVLKYFLADQYIAKSNYVPSAAEREIFTTFFNTIKPLLPLFGGAAILGGPQSSLALQDIVRNYTWRRLGTAATFEKYKGFRGDGSSSYIGTGYIPETDTSRFLLNSHGFGGVFSGEVQTTTLSAMGSYRQGLSPQRGSRGVVGVRSSLQSNDVVNIDYIGDGGEGGFHGVFRNSPDRYELTHRKAVYSVPTPSTTTGAGGNLEMVILSQVNSGGAALGFSTLQCRFAFFGAYLTVEQRALLADAEAAMNASFVALGA